MAHQLQHIPDIAEILFAHGIRDVVISPGSRNAPLIRAFFKRFGDGCASLVDERSAAYFALGKSLATQKPTVLICTSGTAVLNYAPAIAEAYYQHVPLLIISADRPPEWIGQLDNQAIQQINIYGNNIKASYSIPVATTNSDDLWFAHRIVNEAFHKTVSGNCGPVHINVPLREPFYEILPDVSPRIQIIKREETTFSLPENSAFLADWEKANSILIVCGQLPPNNKVLETLQLLTTDPRVGVVAEPISNVYEAAAISNPEVILNNKIKYPDVGIPDLVIYIGGQVVSKKVKLFLRGLQNSTVYRISTDEQIIDTFQNVNAIIYAEPYSILKELKINKAEGKSGFKDFWENEAEKSNRLTIKYIDKIGYSDLLVFKEISTLLPDNAIVFAGNSSVVRYLNYFNQKKRKYYSNRGVSGIDGCLSTAAGLASKVDEPVYVIVGDLAFGYDSNALWIPEFPKNLRIIVLNNGGGNIFRLIGGPRQSPVLNEHFVAQHTLKAEGLANAYGMKYLKADNQYDLFCSLDIIFTPGFSGPVILELFTDGELSASVFQEYFNQIK